MAVRSSFVLEVHAGPEFGHCHDADRVSARFVERSDFPVDPAAVDIDEDGRVTDLHR